MTRRTDTPPTDEPWAPSRGWLWLGAAVVVGALTLWALATPVPAPGVRLRPSAATAPVSTGAAERAASSAVSVTWSLTVPVSLPSTASPVVGPTQARPVRGVDTDQSPDLSDYVNPGEKPTMGEVIARLHAAGVHTGLGAFNPPGTRPPLVGLAVPDDFALPPGYVRHHQATDDGQRIEAILMYAPDFGWTDAQGRPRVLPQERVVPVDAAPPGLPVRTIVLPAPADPGK